MRRIARFVLLVSLAAASMSHAAERTPLTIRFSDGAITAEGVTAGGSVVFFAMTRDLVQAQPPLYGPRQYMEIVRDDDRDGSVRLAVSRNATLGVWAVVDMASGAHGIAPTPGYEPERVVFLPQVLKNDNAGQLRKLEWPFAEIELLLVRPGDGAWRLSASKYSGRDENKNSHAPLRIDVTSMEAVGASAAAAPHNFKPGDVVVVMNPRWMQYGVVEVGK
jgi:hypothetical protein